MGIIQSIQSIIMKRKEIILPSKMEELEYIEGLYFRPNRYYTGNPFLPPPPSGDFSNAISLVIDGPYLKLYDEATYNYLLDFVRMSRSFFYLQFFTWKNDFRTVKSYTGEQLQGIDAFHCSAITAINQYNNLTKKHQLKLEKLLKVNSVYERGPFLYMTFSAIDMDTGTSAKYYAAMAELLGHHLLVLLTRPSATNNNKEHTNLFVLSISGVRNVAVVGKNKFPITNVLPCMDRFVRK